MTRGFLRRSLQALAVTAGDRVFFTAALLVLFTKAFFRPGAARFRAAFARDFVGARALIFFVLARAVRAGFAVFLALRFLAGFFILSSSRETSRDIMLRAVGDCHDFQSPGSQERSARQESPVSDLRSTVDRGAYPSPGDALSVFPV